MKRILILPPSTIDDAVLSSGAIRHLMARHPDALVKIVYETLNSADIYENFDHANIEIVRNYRQVSNSSFWLNFVKTSCWKLWDLVLCMNQVTFYSYLIGRIRTLRIKPHSFPSGLHKVNFFSQKIAKSKEPLAPFLPIKATHRKKAKEILPDKGQALILCPTSDNFIYDWPIEHYIDLVCALTGQGGAMENATVFLAGHPLKRQNILILLDSIEKKRLIDSYGRGHDLLTLAACIERGRLVIGNDGGFLHLAAATYKPPVLGLFGPSDEKKQRPWGSHIHIIRCGVGCDAWDLSRHSMAMLSPETVIKRAEEILSNTSDK